MGLTSDEKSDRFVSVDLIVFPTYMNIFVYT